MEKNNVDEYASINQEYEDLITFPFLFEVSADSMSNAELIKFYRYVLHRNKVNPENGMYNWTLRDLEKFEVIRMLLSGELTKEILDGPTLGRDVLQDRGESSVKDYFEELIFNPYLYENRLDSMTDCELIQFYEYLLRKVDKGMEVQDRCWIILGDLEAKPVIQMYIEQKDIVNGKSKDSDNKSENNLTPMERHQIDETIKILQERRNPIKKLIKYIKG